MSHIRIEQGADIEVVTLDTIHKLYEQTLNSSVDSNLKGTISVSKARANEVAALRNRFPLLTIIVTGGLYLEFADPEVERVLLAAGIGDGVGIVDTEASSITELPSFQGNTTIRSFDELKYFTNVKIIKNNQFKGCTNLTTINFSNITNVNQDAFEGCTSLVSVTNTNNLSRLDIRCFQNCSSLVNIDLSNVGTIRPFAFRYCSSLTAVDLSNVTSMINATIGGFSQGSCFSDCINLASVTTSSALIEVCSNCFDGCLVLNDFDFLNISIMNREAFKNTNITKPIYLPSCVTANPGTLNGFPSRNYYFPALTTLGSGYSFTNWYYNSSWMKGPNAGTNTYSIDVLYFKDLTDFSKYALTTTDNGSYIRNLIINNTTPPPIIDTSNEDHASIKLFGIIMNLYVPDSAVDDYKAAWGGTCRIRPDITNADYDLTDRIKPLSTCPRKTLQEVLNGEIGLIEEYMS